MKWRFFKHLRHGGDEDSERVYRWHIRKRSGARMDAGLATDKWKRSVDDYVASAGMLLSDLQECFRDSHAVPVDPNGELLDGSHRVACALALELETIPVVWAPRYAWAPPWDRAWFEQNGMGIRDLCRVLDDWDRMRK